MQFIFPYICDKYYTEMKKIITVIILCYFILPLSAQTYQQIADRAIDFAQKDSLVQSEKFFKQAIAMEPENKQNVLLYCNLGLVQRKLKQYDDAADSYTFALKMDPTTCSIILKRAAVYMDGGREEDAFKDYNKVLDLKPDNKEARLIRAYIFGKRNQYDQARADYNYLLSANMDDYDARLGIALLNQKTGDFHKAMEILNQLIDEFPSRSALYMARANVEQDIAHPDLALIDVDRSIAIEPNSIDAFVLRGDIHLKLKKKTLAHEDYIRALKLGANIGEIRIRLEKCK